MLMGAGEGAGNFGLKKKIKKKNSSHFFLRWIFFLDGLVSDCKKKNHPLRASVVFREKKHRLLGSFPPRD